MSCLSVVFLCSASVPVVLVSVRAPFVIVLPHLSEKVVRFSSCPGNFVLCLLCLLSAYVCVSLTGVRRK